MGRLRNDFATVRRAVGHVVRPYPVNNLPRGRYLEVPGRGTTYLTDSGPATAPVVFLLHSVMTTGQLCWYPTIPELNARYRVLTVDHRWHGRGMRQVDFSLEECADDIVAIADLLGIDSFTAVGFSMGGGIAQLAWQRHPGRVAGLVLCSTGPFFSSIDPERLAADLRVGRMLAPIDKVLPRPSERRMNEWAKHPARWGLNQFFGTRLSDQGAFSEAMSRFDSRDWLGDVDVPTSVVVSTRDRMVQPERQQLLVDGIAGAERFDVDGGHACCVLGAERFVPQLSSAVDSVVARAMIAV